MEEDRADHRQVLQAEHVDVARTGTWAEGRRSRGRCRDTTTGRGRRRRSSAPAPRRSGSPAARSTSIPKISAITSAANAAVSTASVSATAVGPGRTLHAPEPHHCPDEHHALDAEVEHARALGEQLPERREQDRRPVDDRLVSTCTTRVSFDGDGPPPQPAGRPAGRCAPGSGRGSRRRAHRTG